MGVWVLRGMGSGRGDEALEFLERGLKITGAHNPPFVTKPPAFRQLTLSKISLLLSYCRVCS